MGVQLPEGGDHPVPGLNRNPHEHQALEGAFDSSRFLRRVNGQAAVAGSGSEGLGLRGDPARGRGATDQHRDHPKKVAEHFDIFALAST